MLYQPANNVGWRTYSDNVLLGYCQVNTQPNGMYRDHTMRVRCTSLCPAVPHVFGIDRRLGIPSSASSSVNAVTND